MLGFWNFKYGFLMEPENHWSCIAHLSAEDMLKSAVIEEEKTFKHSPWAGADNPLGPNFLCQQESFITMVICCKFKESLQPLTLCTSFHDLKNVYSRMSGADNPRRQNFDVNRNHLSLRSFATSFSKIYLWNLILYNFSWFYTCI